MNMQARPSFTGYGAYELKMTYQRNMFLGTLLVAAMVALAISGVSLYQYLTYEEVTVINVPPLTDGGGVIFIENVPPIGIRPPSSDAISAVRPDIGIPTPVADDALIDDSFMAPSREDRRAIVDSKFSNVPYVPESSIVIAGEDVDEWPGINDFVPVEIEPKLIFEAVPEFPRMAKLVGIGGTVWVKALVDTNGDVRDVVIIKSSNDVFNGSAHDAAMKFKFSPAIQNGFPVPIWVSFPIEYEIR